MKASPNFLTDVLAAALFSFMSAVQAVAGGIPVIDVTNITQTTVSAMENVSQTLKQLEQYQTQLQQYEDQSRNTMAPSMYLWDQANQIMEGVLSTVDTLENYKQQAGSIDAYLAKFQDVNYYRSSPCFGPNGCTEQEMEALRSSQTAGSEAQKWANDAVIKGIELQQNRLQQDAENLVRLQRSAETVQGRMEAIQLTNQFASEQASQLMQIRSMLLAQQAAEVARLQADADKDAMAKAAHEQAISGGNLYKSEARLW
jgi:P-type conjugative transfer protein TrbJ